MKKEKWWGTILLLLIIMFSFINKDDITKNTVYVTNTNITFEIENLTKKINIDDISYEEINSKEKMLTINNSKEITYQLAESYLSSDFLKKYPNFIFNNERYQIFTVIYNKDIKLLNNHLDYINELQDLSNYYIFYEPKLDDEIILLKVVNKDKEIARGKIRYSSADLLKIMGKASSEIYDILPSSFNTTLVTVYLHKSAFFGSASEFQYNPCYCLSSDIDNL